MACSFADREGIGVGVPVGVADGVGAGIAVGVKVAVGEGAGQGPDLVARPFLQCPVGSLKLMGLFSTYENRLNAWGLVGSGTMVSALAKRPKLGT
jgi:hypothetical protein